VDLWQRCSDLVSYPIHAIYLFAVMNLLKAHTRKTTPLAGRVKPAIHIGCKPGVSTTFQDLVTLRAIWKRGVVLQIVHDCLYIVPLRTTLYVMVPFSGLLLLIFFSNLLYTQLVQLITGLTRHERKVGAQAIPTSPSSIYHNVKQTFGEHWFITWLLPYTVVHSIKCQTE